MIKKIANPMVRDMFQSYPSIARKRLLQLRQLVLDTAAGIPEVGELEETLKWGEPADISAIGSVVRMGWSAASPGSYALYFNCKTSLVETFKEIYPDIFCFHGNRAIIFALEAEIPVAPLAQCISLSLTYKRRKHLPLLGV